MSSSAGSTPRWRPCRRRSWGVAGAALAIGLSNLVVIGYFATWLRRHSEHLSLAPRWFTLSPAVLKPVFGVGVSELLQAGFLIVTAEPSHGGDEVLEQAAA